jgi:NAD(P)-dependent dehydrogenase (short-subunit alcohol dehydrogenase family)
VPEKLRFNDQVAIITGSSKGIGREVAKLLAARGARVIINGRTKATVENTTAQINASGGIARAFIGDVSDPDQARALVADTIEHFGRLDILVNNAGILNSSPFPNVTGTEFNTVMAINVFGPIQVTQAAWPHMLRQGRGQIVMMSSTSIFGAQDSSLYTASKAALVGLTRSLNLEGQAHDIAVNAVMPVAFTDMMTDVQHGDSVNATEGADLWAAAADTLTPQLVAPVVAWLAHPACGARGEILSTGGGRVARILIAEAPGFVDPHLSLETLHDRWPDAQREHGYLVHQDFLTSVFALMHDTGIIPNHAPSTST